LDGVITEGRITPWHDYGEENQETKIDRPPVCNYEGSDYQTTFWELGGREYEHEAESVALRRLLPSSGKLLLELGAGAGRNTPNYGAFERVVLLDYSRTQLQQAQERLGISWRYIYVAADIYHLPFVNGLFDAATMIRTVHHLANVPLALHQIQKVLKPEAIFILEYANKQNLKAILRYLFKRQAWNPFSHEPVEFAELNFDFHPQKIREWLQESGFRVQRHLTVSHFRHGLIKRVVPLTWLVKLDSIAQLTGNWWQITPSVFVLASLCGKEEIEHQPNNGPRTSEESIFACPECGQHPLSENPQYFSCPTCHRRWAIQDGIFNFRESIEEK